MVLEDFRGKVCLAYARVSTYCREGLRVAMNVCVSERM